MISVIMEKEDRRDTEDSPVCRVSLDLQVPLASRELQESLDQVVPGDPQDQLDPLERKDTWDRQDPWDLQEPEDSVERSDQRVLQENLDPQALLVLQDPLWRPWMTSSEALRITTQGLLLLLSSVRTKPCPTATPPP